MGSTSEAKEERLPHGTGTPMKSRKATTRTTQGGEYLVSLPIWFVAILLLASTLISFHVGAFVRRHILHQVESTSDDNRSSIPMWLSWAVMTSPRSLETNSKSQPVGGWVHCQGAAVVEDILCSLHNSNDDDDDSDDDEDDENAPNEHKFHGQQLLTTLDQVEDELIPLLLQHMAARGWSLQSYFQQEEFLSILLFEDANSIVINTVTQTLDIYSTEDDILLDWIDHLSSNLSVNSEKWVYRPRGAKYDTTVVDAGLTDLYSSLLGISQFTLKRLVARIESPFQEVAMYDTIDPKLLDYAAYKAATSSLKGDYHILSSYHRENAHLFQPDRQMFLDGVVQSRTYGERAYHEALVHPAMIMHPHPERVAIVGAGEGATLREVLKHSSLKEVVMIEIDQMVMDLSRQHLQQWNDCSDLILPEGMVNPTGNCFDDPRAKVYAEDAIQWFMDRYPEHGTAADYDNELFDVIIMDALDPGDNVQFSDMLFDNIDLAATFYRALSSQGIFQTQTGEQQHMDDPNELWTRDRHALLFLRNLGKVGFDRLIDYEEPSTRFNGVWSFLLASKATDSSRWYANQAQVDLELQQRAMPTQSGQWPFHYFDGSTMMTYQVTSRPVARVMCLSTPDLPSCVRGPGLDQGLMNVPAESALTTHSNGQVVTRTHIPAGSVLGLDECVYWTWDIPHDAHNLIDSFGYCSSTTSTRWESWNALISKYSIGAPLLGDRTLFLDLGSGRQCVVDNVTLLNEFQAGALDPMLERYWRIHDCAARRTIEEDIPKGTNLDCQMETQ